MSGCPRKGDPARRYCLPLQQKSVSGYTGAGLPARLAPEVASAAASYGRSISSPRSQAHKPPFSRSRRKAFHVSPPLGHDGHELVRTGLRLRRIPCYRCARMPELPAMSTPPPGCRRVCGSMHRAHAPRPCQGRLRQDCSCVFSGTDMATSPDLSCSSCQDLQFPEINQQFSNT